MFSVFPELLSFSLLAVFLLRVIAGYFFLLLGGKLLRAVVYARGARGGARFFGWFLALADLAVGGLLVAGFLTQPAALAGMALSLLALNLGVVRKNTTCEQHVQFLLFVICLALLFLGAGAFAFDLPL